MLSIAPFVSRETKNKLVILSCVYMIMENEGGTDMVVDRNLTAMGGDVEQASVIGGTYSCPC